VTSRDISTPSLGAVQKITEVTEEIEDEDKNDDENDRLPRSYGAARGCLVVPTHDTVTR